MSIGTILIIILVILLLGGFSGFGGGPFYGTGYYGWGTGLGDCHPVDLGFARQNLNKPNVLPACFDPRIGKDVTQIVCDG
jgi:hypothetical protein